MDLLLNKKRALITGASKGIGLATAELLADEGCELVLVARDENHLRQAAEKIQHKSGCTPQCIAADISTASGRQAIAASCAELDVLVNNAGAIPPGDLLGLDIEQWRSAWDLKVWGYMSLTKLLYDKIKQQRGVVVNVIGAAGEIPSPDYLVGSTANAALMMFTRSFARSARNDGVRVVGINPGPVATERFDMLLRAQAKAKFGDAERSAELLNEMPFNRVAQAEEIAAAVAFLASPRSGYTTGTILTIDGGMA
ncbi:MAG: SDR family oxidoreductase [Gammaproteobacteria bacterium]|nr:SDR family oxidoreductase [Gammaproteobacteria bacterium]